MKTFLLSAFGWVAMSIAIAAPPAPSAYEPLRIIQTVPASYPQSVDTIDFPNGEVVILINVDAEGRLVDWLVERSSGAAFTAAAEAALRAWRYSPAKQYGEPVGTRQPIAFSFEPRRVVTTLTGRTYLDRRMEQIVGVRSRGFVARPSELDAPLQAVEVVSPLPPPPTGAAPDARVVLDFYVDSEGRPRMPVVVDAASELHALAAVDALERWRFTPPTSRGRPVAVRVQQEFRFDPEPR